MMDLKFIQLNKNWHKTKNKEIEELETTIRWYKNEINTYKRLYEEEIQHTNEQEQKIKNQAKEITNLHKRLERAYKWNSQNFTTNTQ